MPDTRDARALTPEMVARYGTGRRSRVLPAVVVVVVVAFLVVLGWVTYRLGQGTAQASLVRFSAVSDQQVDVTFEVHRDGQFATVCVLRAQGADHADVGYSAVTITPGRSYVQPTYPLATSSRATTAEVLGCSDDGAPRVDPPQFVPGTVNPPQVPTIDGS